MVCFHDDVAALATAAAVVGVGAAVVGVGAGDGKAGLPPLGGSGGLGALGGVEVGGSTGPGPCEVRGSLLLRSAESCANR